MESRRIDYNKHYHCGFCGNRFNHGEEAKDRKGRSICPRDGHLLRYIPRNKNNKSHNLERERSGRVGVKDREQKPLIISHQPHQIMYVAGKLFLVSRIRNIRAIRLSRIQQFPLCPPKTTDKENLPQ
mgnify:CR=1 FL=1